MEPTTLRAELPATSAASTDPLVTLAVALDRVGLDRERGEALDAAARAGSGETAAFQLALTAVRLGEWGRAYALANGRLWHRAFEERDPGSLALLFPRAYRQAVEDAGASYAFDPAFVWAIMRRESAFDPSVESGARAIGLMQMLLPTAQKISRLLDEVPPTSTNSINPTERSPSPSGTWLSWPAASAKRGAGGGRLQRRPPPPSPAGSKNGAPPLRRVRGGHPLPGDPHVREERGGRLPRLPGPLPLLPAPLSRWRPESLPAGAPGRQLLTPGPGPEPCRGHGAVRRLRVDCWHS